MLCFALAVFPRFLLLASTAGSIANEERMTLQELDRIVSQAKSLDEFLANSERSIGIREQYFTALQQYYGEDKFQRASFDAILGQMRRANSGIQGFGQRLWETTGLGKPYKIEAAVKTTGLELKQAEWRTFIGDWQSDVDQRSASFSQMSPAKIKERINTTLAEASKAIETFEKRLAGLPKGERGQASRIFYGETLPNLEGMKDTKAYLMQRTLALQQNVDVFSSGDADVILATLDEIRSGKGLSTTDGIKIPDNVRSQLARSEVPAVETPPLTVVDGKASESKLFRTLVRRGSKGTVYAIGRAPKTEYEFNPILRRIHGVWKGVPLGECVGGNCSSLNSLTPERWATIALKDTQLYHVERGGSYLGFMHLTPVQEQGRTYASVDFGAPILSNKVGVRAADGTLEAKPFVDLWLDSAMQNKPIEWKGFVVGQSTAISNSGVLSHVHASPAYFHGQQLATPAKEIVHLDPMAKSIVDVMPREGYAQNYGGKMIADAFVPDAGRLTVLAAEGAELEARLRKDPAAFEKYLEGQSAEVQLRWNRYLETKPKGDPLRLGFKAYFKDVKRQKRLIDYIQKAAPDSLAKQLDDIDQLISNRQLVAEARYKVFKSSETSAASKVEFLSWLRAERQTFRGIPPTARLAADIVDSIPPSAPVPYELASMFRHDNPIPMTSRLFARLNARGDRGILWGQGLVLDLSESDTSGQQFEKLKTYVEGLRKHGLLGANRSIFLQMLSSTDENVATLGYQALNLAPKELVPTPAELSAIPVEAQFRVISMINSQSHSRAMLANEEALLKVASQSPDAGIRLMAIHSREAVPRLRPTKLEYGVLDRMLEKEVLAGRGQMLLGEQSWLLLDILKSQNYSRTMTLLETAARTDNEVAEKLSQVVAWIVADPQVDDTIVMNRLRTISGIPAARTDFVAHQSSHVINPNTLDGRYSDEDGAIATQKRRLATLAQQDSRFFAQIRAKAVDYWDEKSVAGVLSGFCQTEFSNIGK